METSVLWSESNPNNILSYFLSHLVSKSYSIFVSNSNAADVEELGTLLDCFIMDEFGEYHRKIDETVYALDDLDGFYFHLKFDNLDANVSCDFSSLVCEGYKPNKVDSYVLSNNDELVELIPIDLPRGINKDVSLN